jgi:putative transcriptional regulator
MIQDHPPRDAGSIAHHPDDALLLAYVSGAADEAVSLIVATHMSYCSLCRLRSRKLEAIGGALLEDLPPAALARDARESVMAKLDSAQPYERPTRPAASPGASEKAEAAVKHDRVPSVLRPYIGGDLARVRWRHMGPRLSYAPLFRRGAVAARLLRGVPGADSGLHSHQGLEFTLVLQGGYTDLTGNYGPGDLQVMEGGMSHNPVADPGEDCINLAVTTGRLTFDSLLQRIAAPLFGF